MVLILVNPVRFLRTAGPEPTAVYLLDESRSMSLEAPISRSQAVDQFISRADGCCPSSAARHPEIWFRPRADCDRRDGKSFRRRRRNALIQALEQFPPRLGDTLPFGVFVFSDGRSTEPDTLEATAKAYRALGVPIHVVPVGDERISGDVAVQDIDAPRDARDARAGSRDPAKPRFRRRAHRALDPRGRRPQGECARDPSRHPR